MPVLTPLLGHGRLQDKATGQSRGFGFVVFTDAAVAAQVAAGKHTIDGREVRHSGREGRVGDGEGGGARHSGTQ
jgi:hypothetical protein